MAANTDNFLKSRRNFSTGIGTGGVADGVTTTIPLSSTTNLPTDTAITATINRVDQNGAATTTSETVVGVVSGSNLVSCVRGVEGTAQAWSAGVVVELLWTETNVNRLVSGIILEHNQDGTHNKTLVTDLVSAQALTNKTITDSTNNVMAKSLKSATTTVDVSAATAPTSGQVLTATSGTAATWQNGGSNGLNQQALINGNFDVWQLGTTITNPTSTSTAYTADQWQSFRQANANNISITQQSPSLSGSRYNIRVQRVAADVQLNPIFLGQSIETSSSVLLQGQYLTLSFYARSGANFSAASSNLTYGVATSTAPDESVYTTSTITNSTTATLTTSWQKFTYTIPSTVGATVNTVKAIFSYTPVGTAGAADYFEVAQVQLCAGQTALPFQPKAYLEELRACQRYLYDPLAGGTAANLAVAMSYPSSTTAFYTMIPFLVTMRGLPTLVISNAASFSLGYPGAIALLTLTLTIASSQEAILGGTTAGHSATQVYQLYRPGTSATIYFDGRL